MATISNHLEIIHTKYRKYTENQLQTFIVVTICRRYCRHSIVYIKIQKAMLMVIIQPFQNSSYSRSTSCYVKHWIKNVYLHREKDILYIYTYASLQEVFHHTIILIILSNRKWECAN